MTNLVLTSDNVRGTVQYVTKTGSTTYVSELLPTDVAVGDRYLCQADQSVYTVASINPTVLNKSGQQVVRVVDPWNGTAPTDGVSASDGNYPDASAFASGPLVGGSGPYYVSVRNGVVEVKTVASITPRPGGVALNDADGYSVVSNAAFVSVTKSVVGGTPASIANLYAAQAEVGVTPKAEDVFDDTRKTALLKAWNILDSAGKLTALGASIENRIKYNAATVPGASVAVNKRPTQHIASPTPGGVDVTYTSPDGTSVSTDPATGVWTGAASSWSGSDPAQLVDFESGSNQSVGFLRGRVAGALTKGAAAPGNNFPAEATVTASNSTNAAKLAGLGYVATPTTAWTTGQKIQIGTYAFSWSGTAWAAGAAT